MNYVLRRVIHGIALLGVLSVLSFVFAELAPGDYFSDLAQDPRITPEFIAELRAQAGLNRPLPQRYIAWVYSVAQGKFGYSLAFRTDAGPLIRARIGGTLLLTGTATAIAWLLALPLGMYHALRRGTWQDQVFRAIVAVLLATPELLLALVLLVLAARTGWLPAGGMHSAGWETMSTGARFLDTLRHLAIPAGVLVAGMLPLLHRHVRAAISEILDAPFVLAARAQGIPRRRLLFRHILPAALHPLISLFGLSIGTLLSASLLVEIVTGWPGLGPLFLDAIMQRDLAIVLGIVMVSAATLIAGNLAADLILYRVDPRIRKA